MTKKMCAVCGDITQLNVRKKWKRDRDGIVFNVCMYCAEQGLVNETSVSTHCGNKTYSPVASDPIGDRMFTSYTTNQWAKHLGITEEEAREDRVLTILDCNGFSYILYKDGTYIIEK